MEFFPGRGEHENRFQIILFPDIVDDQDRGHLLFCPDKIRRFRGSGFHKIIDRVVRNKKPVDGINRINIPGYIRDCGVAFLNHQILIVSGQFPVGFDAE